MISPKLKIFEKKFISKINRFTLSQKELKKISNDFKNANLLITGAAGSIGSVFTNKIINLDYKNIFLLDKDENKLTDLNRYINSIVNTNKINKINYICSDLSIFKIDQFIINNSITHYLNFAAIKHVRSEENIESIKYMFKTNSDLFLPSKKISKNSNLKKVFSVSTDKVSNPTSILGVSKKLMEYRLCEFKKKNPRIFVSSARFANVSFSNGSILKHIVESCENRKSFGVPENIYRYFITHEEAASLCFKSLINEVDGKILIPKKNIVNKIINIKNLSEKILKYSKLKPIYNNKKNKLSKNEIRVYLTKDNIQGQKSYEEFSEETETIIASKNIQSTDLINLYSEINTNQFIKRLVNLKKIDDIFKYIKNKFPSYQHRYNVKKISKII